MSYEPNLGEFQELRTLEAVDSRYIYINVTSFDEPGAVGLHRKMFDYPIARKFRRYPWIPPVVLVFGLFWFAFVTVISVMVVGYEVKEIPVKDYNKTIPSWTWNLPRIPKMKTCRPSNIKINEGKLSFTHVLIFSGYNYERNCLRSHWLPGSQNRSACRWIGLSKQSTAKLFCPKARDRPTHHFEHSISGKLSFGNRANGRL